MRNRLSLTYLLAAACCCIGLLPSVKGVCLARAAPIGTKDETDWRPFLGIDTAVRGGIGIRVTRVVPGSPAEQAGITAGDIIYEFADKKFYKRIQNPDELSDLVLLSPVDQPIKVVFLHNGQTATVQVRLRATPFLGVMYSGHKGQGFLVRGVVEGSPAGKAGIMAGDLVIAYGDKSFTATALPSHVLSDTVCTSPFNTPIKLTLLRKNEVTNKVVVCKGPSAYSGPQAELSAQKHEASPGDRKPVADLPTQGQGGALAVEKAAQAGPPPVTGTLFEDNFDSENGAKGRLNYRGFEKWFVTRGDVDLIGNGFMDYQPGNGLYVDLDGSPGGWNTAVVAGTLQTKKPITLPAGKYLLKFDLAGHPHQGPNTVTVRLANVFREDFTLERQSPNTGFKTISRAINVSTSTQGHLLFEHRGGDYSGLLLDNILLSVAHD